MKTKFLILLVILFVYEMKGQTSPPPADWKAVTWREKNLMNVSGLSQALSGDEWWFSHKNLYDGNGKLIGYIACGYLADLVKSADNPQAGMRLVFNEGSDSPFNSYPSTGSLFTTGSAVNWLPNGGCDEFYDILGATSTVDAVEQKTPFRGMLARLDLKGNMIWCRLPNIHGDGLQELIQVGNYIYVVGAHYGAKNTQINYSAGNNNNRGFLSYNAIDATTAASNKFNVSTYPSITYTLGSGVDHIYVAKYDLDGTKIWEGLYGSEDFSTSPNNAWNSLCKGWDLIMNSNGSLYVVGQAGPSANYVFMTKLDPSNGYVLDNNTFALPTTAVINQFGEQSENMIGKSICEIGSTGTMVIGGVISFQNANSHGDVDAHRGFLLCVNPDLSLNTTSSWAANNPITISATNTATKMKSNIWEVNYHSNKNEILAGVINNCDDCARTDNNHAEGQVWRYTPGGAFSASVSIGAINAFDLRLGVIETSDHGFAVISSRRHTTPSPPTLASMGSYSNCPNLAVYANNSPVNYGVWDTDPLIVKFDASDNKEWEWNEDVVPNRTTRVLPPGDFKRQECMYKISESFDQGLVVSGNCSFNHDDNYMVKLYTKCNSSQTYSLSGHTIYTNTTWNSSFAMKGVLEITYGTTLTITGSSTKIRFADSKSTGIPTYIKIDQGGCLRLENGAEITSIDNSACPGSMWDGIVILGNSSQSQGSYGNYATIASQGYLSINNATISNARCAAYTGAYGSNTNNYNGGVIDAKDAYFVNNERDVQIMDYNTALPNKCRFITSHFLIKDELNSREKPVFRIYMQDVRGVILLGNEFKYNASNAYDPIDRGWGIYSNGADYKVQDYSSNTGIIRSSFENFRYGIEVDNCNYGSVVSIDNAIFTNTYTQTSGNAQTGGILLHSNDVCRITRNTININCENSFGISINNSKNYSIASNTITGNHSQWSVGIYASNSGAGDHRIMRNNLTNLNGGIYPQYANSASTSNVVGLESDGLLMNCNTFTGNDFDIAMLSDNLTPPSVRENQGIVSNPFAPNPNLFVRNRYSATCSFEEQWYIDQTSSKYLQHFSNPNGGGVVTLPLCGNPFLNANSAGSSYNFSAQCPENESIPRVNPGNSCSKCDRLLDINTALGNAATLSNSLTSIYTNSVDGGNTASLLGSISNTTISDPTLKSIILGYSPYLSDTVLKAYFARNLGNQSNIVDIHDVNKPVTTNVWQFIEGLSLTPTVIEDLEEQQAENLISERKILGDALGSAKADLQFVYSEKLNYFLQDTLETALDTVLNLLVDNLGNLPNADIMRVNIYATMGDYTRAFAYADSLGGIDKYEELMVLQKTLLQLDTSVAGLNKILVNEDLYDVVSEYASNSAKQGYWLARSVMRHVYDGKSFDSITKPLVFEMNLHHLNPSTSGARSFNPIQNSVSLREESSGIVFIPTKKYTKVNVKSESQFQNTLNVYPNPANESLFLLFNSSINMTFDYSIRDILGRELLNGRIESGQNLEINTNSLINGIYFITLVQNNQVVENKRFAIVK